MTDFFVNLIASAENMPLVYLMFAILVIIGAGFVSASYLKSHVNPAHFLLWIIFSVVTMFYILTIQAGLHNALNERKTTQMILFQADGYNIGLINHSKRSRESIDDEFGEWEIYDVTVSPQYKNYLIQELN